MSLGSKFAHLWQDEASQSASSETSELDLKDDDSLNLMTHFLRSIDPESLNAIQKDGDTSDLFASFGYDTGFGLTSSPVNLSPVSSTNGLNRGFLNGSSTTSSWPSDHVSGGCLSSCRNISDLDGGTNRSHVAPGMPFPSANVTLSPNFSPRKSDGDSIGAFGCQGLAYGTNGSYRSCSSGLDRPLLTSSPISTSPVDLDTSVFHGNDQHMTLQPTMSNSLTQTLAYIANQLAEVGHGYQEEEVSPRSPWGNRRHVSSHLAPETIQKWIVLLRNIQDSLMTAGDMSSGQRAQMLELSCTLQRKLLCTMIGEDKDNGGIGGSNIDLASESQLQAAKFLRDHAGFPSQTPSVWRGVLPRRDHVNATYSTKVFLGGLPYDMTAPGIAQAFKQFGSVIVEWPGIDTNPLQHKGYAYIIFENERQVKCMLSNCNYAHDGKWFCQLSSRRVRMKDVEVIPWALADSNFAMRPSSKLEPKLTIFVGALHGMLNAEGLAVVMDALYGGVLHAGIDTDRNKYPIGSGRLTFDNFHSYFSAIAGAFVEIKSSKFSKVVQVDPYLEDSNCSHCSLQQAPYFCRNLSCFRYYCRTCFELAHATESLRTHRPLMRNPNKKSQTTGFSSPSSFKTNYRA